MMLKTKEQQFASSKQIENERKDIKIEISGFIHSCVFPLLAFDVV